MTGGSLTLKKGANAALLVSKNINISGGTVNINADGAQADYVWGMRAQKDINITGGNVTVNSKSESITTWAEGDTSTVLNEFGVPTPDKKAGGSINISGENTSVKVSAPNTLGESAILAVGNTIKIESPLGFVNPQNGKIVTDNGNQYVVTPDYLVARDIEIAKGGTSVVYSDMPSSDPGNPSNNTVVDLGKIRSFVTRMYTQVLGRNPEDAGLNDWVKQLADKSNNGAGLAKGFILSTEFTQRNLSNEEYVRIYNMLKSYILSDLGAYADYQARAYMSQSKYEKALQMMKYSIEQVGYTSENTYYLGFIYHVMEQNTLAAYFYKYCMLTFPDGEAYLSAEVNLKTLLENNPDLEMPKVVAGEQGSGKKEWTFLTDAAEDKKE